ncbi:MAG: PfkB family carbohydrate kinase [Methanobacterium sp.]
MSKVTLMGPVSEDIIIKDNSSHRSIGGPVFYQSYVFSRLKININALVSISKNDKELLNAFPSPVKIFPFYVDETMKFQNIYPDNNPCNRVQKAKIPHNPIKINKIKDKIKYSDAILLGPLSPYDIPLKTIEDLSSLKIPIYLGAQGYLRYLDKDKIILRAWDGFEEFLKFINILFIDINESSIILGKKYSPEETARLLTSFGPQEVIITRGSSGSLIYSKKLDEVYKIPAIKPSKIEDPTGLGDTYMAAYAARKLEIDSPKKCGMFAAAAASIKLENKGPFKGDIESIENKLKKHFGPVDVKTFLI